MPFVFFQSIKTGINLDHVEWYFTNDDMSNLTFKMMSGKKFFISDEHEISYFFDTVTLMEVEE